MKKQKTVDNRILIVAADNDFRDRVRSILEKEGYEVLGRQSTERTIQLLEMTEVSLIISDFELEDGNYFDLLKAIRTNNTFYQNTAFFGIGNDSNPDECVNTFNAGADDYYCKPLNRKIFVVRTNKIIDTLVKIKNNPVSLELRVDSGELPGFFQFLEAEAKTGHLSATCKKDTAEIIFQDGKVVNAETEYCVGKDALTEVLCWPFCHLKFSEKEIDGKFDISLNVSGTLMDCVFEVDEYKEVLASFPNFEISYTQGLKALPKESNRVAKKVHRMASSGTFLDELLESIKINRRHLILLIDQLVKMGHLQMAKLPFADYLDQHRSQYKAVSVFRKSLPGIISAIESLDYSEIKELDTISISSNKTNSPSSPEIIIAGDHHELNEILFKTFHKIAANSASGKSGIKSLRNNETSTELIFKNSANLNMHKLPPRIDDHFLKQMEESFSKTICVFFIVSGLDRETSRKNRKYLKKLRDYYKGAFYLIVPNLNQDNPEVIIDCKHCFHKLAIDIDHEGSMGNCPICNTEITIPACLEYSAQCLNLSPDVAKVFLNPLSSEECRDVLALSCNSLLHSLPPPKEKT